MKTNTNTQAFLCDDGLEHRIGQNAHDSGHGARPVGPQICLKCKTSLSKLIDQYVQQKVVEAEMSGIKKAHSLIEGVLSIKLSELEASLTKKENKSE